MSIQAKLLNFLISNTQAARTERAMAAQGARLSLPLRLPCAMHMIWGC